MTHPSATKLKEGGGPVLNSISIILIQSIHLLFECTEEVGLLGLKGGWGASENLSISLFPNLPSSNWEDDHEVVMLTVLFSFFNGVKEVQLMIPINDKKVPTFHTEGALK
jgi:hypothetical protein